MNIEQRERTIQALRDIGREYQKKKALETLEGYRRAALGEVIIPEPMYPDERGVWPVTIPPRVMCSRLLEWNDAPRIGSFWMAWNEVWWDES